MSISERGRARRLARREQRDRERLEFWAALTIGTCLVACFYALLFGVGV